MLLHKLKWISKKWAVQHCTEDALWQPTQVDALVFHGRGIVAIDLALVLVTLISGGYPGTPISQKQPLFQFHDLGWSKQNSKLGLF